MYWVLGKQRGRNGIQRWDLLLSGRVELLAESVQRQAKEEDKSDWVNCS